MGIFYISGLMYSMWDEKYFRKKCFTSPCFNPHYPSNLLKMNANAGYPGLVEPNFGQLDWL